MGIRLGSLVETRNAAMRAVIAPEGFRLAPGESVVRTLNTGTYYIARLARGRYRDPVVARVALYTVTTEVDSVTGRAAIYGRRGRFVTDAAKTLASNIA